MPIREVDRDVVLVPRNIELPGEIDLTHSRSCNN